MDNKAMEPVKDVSGIVTNYMRLQCVLHSTSTEMLRQKFKESWKLIRNSDWENTPENGKEFYQTVGSGVYSRAGSIQKPFLKSGDISKWDLALLIDSLNALDKTLKSKFEPLKKIRNQISHQGSLEIKDEEFEKLWATISEILLSNGVSQQELDDNKKISIEDQKRKMEEHLNEVSMVKANELKEVGNEFYRNKKLKEAIAKYSEAILLPGISSNDLAVLYSNRSIAYLKCKDFQSAKEDAKAAYYLRPSWFRGYHRLGSVYHALEKFQLAEKNFQLAHGLEPSNAQVKNDLDHCRHDYIIRRESEHMDPINFVESLADVAKQMNIDYGTSLSAQALELMHKLGGTDICEQGDNYRFGRGVNQDFAAAARFYTKAARLGSANGLYLLALLTMKGQGVTRNAAEAIRLLQQAASQEPSIMSEELGMKIPNTGVAESEHALGHSYEEGVSVPFDIDQAMYWYERAIKHGSGDAANNVGLLYSNGKKIPGNTDKAIQYYKLSAFMKVVRAMECLTHLYFYLNDLVNSQKWHAYAIAKGSVSLKVQFQDKFKLITENNLRNPLDVEAFEAQLSSDVRNGPLKHLISDENPYLAMEKILVQSGLKCSTTSNRNETFREIHGLKDPYRIEIIKRHREKIQAINSGIITKFGKIAEASLKHKPEIDLTNLKPIYFKDMTATEDHIYDGFVIKLTSIEDASLGTASVDIIAEDEKGDAKQVYIYNFKKDKETQNLIGYGCRFSILSPYFRFTTDGFSAIRVDDPKHIHLQPNLTDTTMCRFCGKKNSTLACRKCKRVFYCSRECKNQDEAVLNHELVCKKRLTVP